MATIEPTEPTTTELDLQRTLMSPPESDSEARERSTTDLLEVDPFAAGIVQQGVPPQDRRNGAAVHFARVGAILLVTVPLLICWQGIADSQESKGDTTKQDREESKKSNHQTSNADPRVVDASTETRKFSARELEILFQNRRKQNQSTEPRSSQDRETKNQTPLVERPAGGTPPPANSNSSSAAELIGRNLSTTQETSPSQGPSSKEGPRRIPQDKNSLRGHRSLNHPLPPLEAKLASAADLSLSEVRAPDLVWLDGFELAMALQKEFSDGTESEQATVDATLKHALLDFSRLAGQGDNPLPRLQSLLQLLQNTLRLEVTELSTIETLVPATTLAEHRVSPLGWCVLALAIADRTQHLELEPVLCNGEIALRYENGSHRYLLSPRRPDRVLTDREFSDQERATGTSHNIRPITRQSFWGRVLAEGAIDQIEQGVFARGMELVEKALLLDPQQPRALIAQARGFLERREESRALESLAQAIRLDPSDQSARRKRVEVFLDLGRSEAAAEDLQILAESGVEPEDTLSYARFLLQKGRFRSAKGALTPLRKGEVSHSLQEEVRALSGLIEATAWVEVLESSPDPLKRLQAARRLGSYPIPISRDALIGVLDDPSGRLSAVALAQLRKITGIHHLGRLQDEWRRAIEAPNRPE